MTESHPEFAPQTQQQEFANPELGLAAMREAVVRQRFTLNVLPAITEFVEPQRTQASIIIHNN